MVADLHADSGQDYFIICGLGSLGQQTILNLKKFSRPAFAIHIAAIDLALPVYWEVEALPDLLVAPPIIGDCRRHDLLKQAGIEHCRAILIVTSDESANIETAMAARRLNPAVQIVLRSSQHNLNRLLREHLGHFVALDATELPATTLALAGLDQNMLSVFTVNDYQFRVSQRRVSAGDPRYDQMPLHRLHRRHSRFIDRQPRQAQPPAEALSASTIFHRWQPQVRVQVDDLITVIEVEPPHVASEHPAGLLGKLRRRLGDLKDSDWHRQFFRFWRQTEQQSLRRVIAIALPTALILWLSGTLILKSAIPDLTWIKAVSLGIILILGGYGDVFGGLEEANIPGWLLLACLLISLTSLVLVLGALGLAAEQVLSSRFEFLRRRPPLPRANHVIVVGLGRVGHRVLTLLQAFNQPLVGIASQLQYPELLYQAPLLIGPVLQELKSANLATARSVIAVTDDPMLNLEIALIVSEAAAARGHAFVPVIRTLNQAFSDNLSVLLPQAKAFSVYALSAEAFAGAAFGENILSLFRLREQTILVTEYRIEADDTLNGLLLAEVAYGYGVMPILLETRNLQGHWESLPLPGDDLQLHPGDRLYILASINGLRRIERGERTAPRRWRLEIEQPLNHQVLLDAGNILAKLSGLELSQCRTLMKNLPAAVVLPLYDYQAQRLQEKLKRYLPIRLLML